MLRITKSRLRQPWLGMLKKLAKLPMSTVKKMARKMPKKSRKSSLKNALRCQSSTKTSSLSPGLKRIQSSRSLQRRRLNLRQTGSFLKRRSKQLLPPTWEARSSNETILPFITLFK